MGILEFNRFELAVSYRKLGFSIIPLKGKYYSFEEDKYKSPLVNWKKYQEILPTTEEIKAWFDLYPYADIGCVTGKVSNIVVVDFDNAKSIKWATQNNLLDTVLVETGRGLHAYYRYPSTGTVKKSIDIHGVDIKSDGGYVVLPPAVHKSGKRYKWLPSNCLPVLSDLKELPTVFLETNTKQTIGDTLYNSEKLKDLYKGVTKGNRNTSLCRIVGSWLSDGLTYNECLDLAYLWNTRNTPPLSDKEIESTVSSLVKLYSLKNNQKKSVHNGYISFLKYPIGINPPYDSSQKLNLTFKYGDFIKKMTILNSVSNSLPNAFDEMILMAIGYLYVNNGVKNQTIIDLNTLPSLSDMLQIDFKNEDIQQQIEDSVFRLKSVSYTFSSVTKTNEVISTKSFYLFDKVFKNQSENLNVVYLNKQVADDFINLYTNGFDFKTYLSLQGIDRIIYKLLLSIPKEKNVVVISISNLYKYILCPNLSMSKISESLKSVAEMIGFVVTINNNFLKIQKS